MHKFYLALVTSTNWY